MNRMTLYMKLNDDLFSSPMQLDFTLIDNAEIACRKTAITRNLLHAIIYKMSKTESGCCVFVYYNILNSTLTQTIIHIYTLIYVNHKEGL